MQIKEYAATTQQIKVSVKPAYLEDQSDPDEKVYAFAYTITIENHGDVTVQLIERHWRVFSAGTQIAEVVGPGVVGEQPKLEPGQSYQYTSGTVIHDTVGTMEGAYTFRSQEGQYFQVIIPEFDLICPSILN